MKDTTGTTLHYTGKKQPTAEEIRTLRVSPYRPSDELVEVVNLAITLQRRPLLIKGEPGTGKTQLAQHVAYELGLWPLHAWYVKSTGQARDGLYIYDAVLRLFDAQIADHRELGEPARQRMANKWSYVTWGALGTALGAPETVAGAMRPQRRSVVLIDEIDKADIDFPNDLLLELDEQKFVVTQYNELITADPDYPPIVFITSNDEKVLPDAFLRRCLFFYINHPGPQELIEIVKLHFGSALPELVNAAVKRFWDLREEMRQRRGQVSKLPSTSELLDWFAALSQDTAKALGELAANRVPSPYALLKSKDDLETFAPAPPATPNTDQPQPPPAAPVPT